MSAARLVMELVVTGLDDARIVGVVREQHESTTAKQAALLIRKARAALTASSSVDRQEELGRSLARLNELYARTMRIQDYKAALAVERERIKLLALDTTPEASARPSGAVMNMADLYKTATSGKAAGEQSG